MDTCLYVVEGEIEKRFLTELKQLECFGDYVHDV